MALVIARETSRVRNRPDEIPLGLLPCSVLGNPIGEMRPKRRILLVANELSDVVGERDHANLLRKQGQSQWLDLGTSRKVRLLMLLLTVCQIPRKTRGVTPR